MKFQKKKKSGTIILLVAILSFLLFSLFLLYHQFTKSNQINSADYENYIKAKNKILNVKHSILKLFENDASPGYDWKYDFWFNSPVIFKYGEAVITLRFYDEDSKINVNQVLYPDGKINFLTEKLIRNILEAKQLSPEYVNTFIDWIDEDNSPGISGAEKNDYTDTSLNLPPNLPFSLHSEFLLLKNLKGNFSDNIESDTVNLMRYFTVYGDNKYNLNTVSSEILESFNFLDKLDIDAIIDFRDKFPIKEITDLPNLIPELNKNNFELIDGYLKTRSDILRIEIETQINNYKLKYIWIYDKNFRITLFNKFCM